MRGLWPLVASPAIWAAHLLLSYATVAIWCAKLAGPGGPLGTARLLVGGYSLLALLGIAAVAWPAWARHRSGGGRPAHDADASAARHRFLGFAALLLAGLSAVAVAFAALALAFIEDCR